MNQIKVAPGLDFSQLVYGLMNAGQWGLSDAELLDHLKFCLDQGITTYDHADIYGRYTCEAIFGNALKLDHSFREKITLVTKCGIQLLSNNRPDTYIKHYNTSRDHIIWSAEQSLKNLHTDRIDVLLIHRPDPMINLEEVAEAFSELFQSGKVRYFGVSNFSPLQMDSLQRICDVNFVTNQIEISVLHPDPFHDGTLDYLQSRKLVPMAWSPLAGGRVFSSDDESASGVRDKCSEFIEKGVAKSVDQLLLAWLMKHPSGIAPIVGTQNRDRISSAIESLDVILDRQQWFELYKAANGEDVP